MAVNESTLKRRSENVREPGLDASVTDRVRYLIARMRKTQQQFAALLNIDGPNLSRILNGHSPFTDAMINRIVVNLGVSKEWILTGKDVPFAKNTGAEIEVFGTRNEEKTLSPVPVGAPVYDIDVTAGYSELSSMFTDDRIVGYLQLPDFPTQNAVVRVSGNSMAPNIPDRAFLSIREIGLDTPIFWGSTYLIVMENYRMVKIIRKHSNPKKVILHSINPDFDDMDVKLSDIKALYIVDAVINYNILS